MDADEPRASERRASVLCPPVTTPYAQAKTGMFIQPWAKWFPRFKLGCEDCGVVAVRNEWRPPVDVPDWAIAYTGPGVRGVKRYDCPACERCVAVHVLARDED